MQHPVIENNIIARGYWLAGILLLVIDFLFIKYGFQTTNIVAAFNALIYNLVILLLILSLWYPVFYLNTNKGIVYNTIQFAITISVFLTIWYVISSSVVNLVAYNFNLNLTVAPAYPLVRVFSGVFVFLVFLAVYFILIYSHRIQNEKQKQIRMAGLLKEAELSALKSQLNPHFLFNSLNSISSLTITKPESARKMINELSDFLRYSLQHNRDMLSLQEELSNVLRYLEIEKVRFGDKIVFESEIEEIALQKKIPSLILQPLIENAIKYGVYESIDPVLIRICGFINKGDLVISIENEYDKQTYAQKGEGIGLNNIKKRMLNTYNKSDLLNINKTDNLFKVTLTFPQLLI